MLQFKQSDTAAILIVTLTENVTLSDPYFLFVFTHILTKQQVKFLKYVSDDISAFTSRYNSFTIDPSVVFLNKPIGQWNYKIYEQVSSTNTDEAQTGSVLEWGKLILDRATAFAPTKYNEPTSYKAYNG